MFLVLYLVLVNVAAFLLFGIDKKKAENGKYRISEATLIAFSIVGGALGAFLGMRIFHHKTKKKKFYITVPVFLVLLIIACIFCLYQNYHIVVTEYEYEAGFDYRVVQISDFHNQLFGFNQGAILKKIKEQKPDIIVVTGDAVDSTHTCYQFTEDFFEGAVEIAPVYYITGNHEVRMHGERYDEYINNIQNLGVHFIDGQKVELENIQLIGTLDNNMDNVPKFDTGNKLKMLLAHEPNDYEKYEESGADIVLTGHVHGGQIIIPGKGGLFSPDFGFFPELYEGEHQFGNTTMIISRGLGNSVAPVRINNYPEIVVLDIH